MQPAEVEEHLPVQIVIATRPHQVERRLVQLAKIISGDLLVVPEEVQRLDWNLPVTRSLSPVQTENGILGMWPS